MLFLTTPGFLPSFGVSFRPSWQPAWMEGARYEGDQPVGVWFFHKPQKHLLFTKKACFSKLQSFSLILKRNQQQKIHDQVLLSLFSVCNLMYNDLLLRGYVLCLAVQSLDQSVSLRKRKVCCNSVLKLLLKRLRRHVRVVIVPAVLKKLDVSLAFTGKSFQMVYFITIKLIPTKLFLFESS